MFYEEDYATLAAVIIFYLVFLGVWWLICGIIGHALLNKKGYRHPGLYVLAWVPMLNWIFIFLFMGLPDALLNRKIDYLLRQMAANGMIQPPPMPYPTYNPAPMPGPAQPAPQGMPAPAQPTPQFSQPNQSEPQQPAAPQQSKQPVWQPPQNQQAAAGPVSPEKLFGPGSKTD